MIPKGLGRGWHQHSRGHSFAARFGARELPKGKLETGKFVGSGCYSTTFEVAGHPYFVIKVMCGNTVAESVKERDEVYDQYLRLGLNRFSVIVPMSKIGNIGDAKDIESSSIGLLMPKLRPVGIICEDNAKGGLTDGQVMILRNGLVELSLAGFASGDCLQAGVTLDGRPYFMDAESFVRTTPLRAQWVNYFRWKDFCITVSKPRFWALFQKLPGLSQDDKKWLAEMDIFEGEWALDA